MSKNEYIYGTQYYRHPNPPIDQHKFHLEKIKNELGFNLVKYSLQWNAIQIKPHLLKLDEINEMFDYCDELGLKVMVEIKLESAPYWMERQYPNARYVSANGDTVELGPHDALQSGGFPGLCFHNDVVIQEAEKYLTQLIDQIKHRKSLYGYDCWNEPHLEPAWICNYWGNMGDRLYCYCNESRKKFRQWLKNKYGSIENVNSTWARFYGEWDDINPPNRHGTYADWLDWIRFWFDSLREHMVWRYQTIKKADPERFVMSHSGAVPPFIPRPNAFINNWSLASPVDKWGTSFAPKFHNWSLAECAGTMDATRSAARGKEFWISEMTGGSCYKKGFEKTPITREKDVRAWNWLAIAYGAKAIVYWCYLTESTGPEAGSFGLIEYSGKTTARAREASKQKVLIEKYNDIIENYIPKADVAILYDPDNSSLLFAMEGGDEFYSQSHIGYYRAIWNNDLYAKYVTYDCIDEIEEKLLIIPMCLTIDKKTAGKIKEFVKRGGILITEARTGLFDERGFLQPEVPSFGLSEIAGLTEAEAYCSYPRNRPGLNNPNNLGWPDDIYSGPEIAVEYPDKNKFRAHGYLSPLILNDAKSIGQWKDICLIAKNQYGDGEVYYFGTCLGMALFNGDKGAQKTFADLLNKYITPKISGQYLRPRIIESKGSALLTVFNDNRSDKYKEIIKLPQKYKKAVNVFENKAIRIENSSIKVEVEPEDVMLIRLENQ